MEKHSPAVQDLLKRNPPNLSDLSVLKDDERSSVTQMEQAVSGMQSTVLMVQGPPGTGKTFVSARAILSLVSHGLPGCRVVK